MYSLKHDKSQPKCQFRQNFCKRSLHFIKGIRATFTCTVLTAANIDNNI